MWIASTLGYFSVSKHSQEGMFMIAARRPADLKNLKRQGIRGTYREILLMERQAELIVTADELTRFYALLAQSINYSNFRRTINGLPDQADKVDLYDKMWSEAYGYQHKLLSEGGKWGEAISLDEVAEQPDGEDYQARAYQEWKRLQSEREE